MAIDKGTDVSSDMDLTPGSGSGCTGGTDCRDHYGTDVPVDGDDSGGAQWDIGVFEYYFGFTWGKASPV